MSENNPLLSEEFSPRDIQLICHSLKMGGSVAKEARNRINGLSDAALANLFNSVISDWTGLSSKRLLEDNISEALKNPELFGLLVVTDLVKFKDINNTYNHFTGDSVLKLAANAMLKVVRTNDGDRPSDKLFLGESASRIGGDEFALFLADGNELANANHEQIVRDKLESMICNEELISELGRLGITTFGVRANAVKVDPKSGDSFADIFERIGPKDAYPYEYHLLPENNNELTVVRIK